LKRYFQPPTKKGLTEREQGIAKREAKETMEKASSKKNLSERIV
jgi:hypothetical protein